MIKILNMTKEELRNIVYEVVSDTWHNVRSIDPIGYQTEKITDKLWEKSNKGGENN
jgi:hypothetical protein